MLMEQPDYATPILCVNWDAFSVSRKLRELESNGSSLGLFIKHFMPASVEDTD